MGRSGTFITIHAQMERMKSEAVVDIFQFIKSVRFQRAGLVANKVRISPTNTSIIDPSYFIQQCFSGLNIIQLFS